MTKGEKIVALREKKGLRSVDLADKIGVSKQLMYKYENDIITNIPSDKLEMISSVLNSSPAYLMGWEDEEGKKLFGEDIDRELEKMPRNEKEEAILSLFRLLSDEQKQLVTNLIEGLLSAKKS